MKIEEVFFNMMILFFIGFIMVLNLSILTINEEINQKVDNIIVELEKGN